MLFNSIDYFLFLVTTLLVLSLIKGAVVFRAALLLAASYVFYTSNNGWLILLILASTCIDYVAALTIDGAAQQRTKKIALLTSVVANLSILSYYKYADFFRQSISGLASSAGYDLGWVDLNIILPVGISFYTFQSMSYTIDVYRGDLRAEKSWIKFAFYVAYFPQLIAGPIMRATYFLPQLEKTKRLTTEDVETGVFLIARGLIKKVVLADFLALYADRAFGLGEGMGSLDLLIGLYAFTLQIYFDFSGYTDIAIGSSRLMGYRIPDNFNKPYVATSFSDFWRRWHISLSSWLKDYLYVTLGGNRHGKLKTYRNLMLTMLLGGLWHGAAWQFVLWGFMHGAYLAIERWLGWGKTGAGNLLIRRLVIFHCVVLTWIPFRSESLASTVEYFTRLLTFEGNLDLSRGGLAVLLILVGTFLLQFITDLRPTRNLFLQYRISTRVVAYGLASVLVVVANSNGVQPFIYFQF